MTPHPPKRRCQQTAVVVKPVATDLKYKYITKELVRRQFPLPGGQGVRDGK